MFSIVNISHGWFEIKLAGCDGCFVASYYLSYDFPKELLIKLNLLLNGTDIEYVCVQDEPCALILKLSLNEEKTDITITITESVHESMFLDLNCLELEQTENICFQCVYGFTDFVHCVISQMQLQVEKLGIQGYNDNWFEYPVELIRKICKQIN